MQYAKALPFADDHCSVFRRTRSRTHNNKDVALGSISFLDFRAQLLPRVGTRGAFVSNGMTRVHARKFVAACAAHTILYFPPGFYLFSFSRISPRHPFFPRYSCTRSGGCISRRNITATRHVTPTYSARTLAHPERYYNNSNNNNRTTATATIITRRNSVRRRINATIVVRRTLYYINTHGTRGAHEHGIPFGRVEKKKNVWEPGAKGLCVQRRRRVTRSSRGRRATSSAVTVLRVPLCRGRDLHIFTNKILHKYRIPC